MNNKININPSSTKWLEKDDRVVADYFCDLGFRSLKQILDMRVFDLMNMQGLNAVRVEEVIICLYKWLKPHQSHYLWSEPRCLKQRIFFPVRCRTGGILGDNFDTSHVTDMHYMFSGCYSLTDLDLSSFDFSNVENYGGFMDNGRLYNGQPWEELFPNGSSDSAFRSQPTLAAGGFHTVGIRSDGTVVATGNDDYGQRNIYSWSNIVAVAAGDNHTVGLHSDGTVVATGSNKYGQCDVNSWTDIVAVAAGVNHTVGLRSDGTVVATGNNDGGQCDVTNWTDIVAVAAGGWHTVGLCSDGTVVATGRNDIDLCDVNSRTDIVAVAAGFSHTVGLRSDGTVVAIRG